MKYYLTIIGFSLFAFCLKAQLKPVKNSTSETWYDKVPVSGEIRTGLMTGENCTEKVKTNFFVKLPNSHNANYLNIDIISNDGRYMYTAHYELKDKQGGVIEIVRASNMSNKLVNYKCEDLTILAWINNDPLEEKEKFVLANWDSNFDSKNVTIYLNSENKSVIYLENKTTKKSNTVPCEAITGQANVAYNCLCKVSVSDLKNASKVSIVQRVRRSQIRHDMSIKL